MLKRHAIRAVMLNPDGEILLMQSKEPDSDFTVWFAPGGGIEDGEDTESCLRRELREETGLEDFDIGPLIWKRHHVFDWGVEMIDQEESFHLVCTDHFTPDMQTNPSETELMSFLQFRWWSATEITESQDTFAPRELAMHLDNLNNNGLPTSPIDVGI